MDVAACCITEIVELHAFLADWLNGRLDDTDAGFARIEVAVHPEFTIVAPSGVALDRQTLLAQLRQAHGSIDATAPMRIDIRNVAAQVVRADGALVTYEEWQYAGETLKNRRMSTAYFDVDLAGPNDVRWRHLHETWVPSD